MLRICVILITVVAITFASVSPSALIAKENGSGVIYKNENDDGMVRDIQDSIATKDEDDDDDNKKPVNQNQNSNEDFGIVNTYGGDIKTSSADQSIYESLKEQEPQDGYSFNKDANDIQGDIVSSA